LIRKYIYGISQCAATQCVQNTYREQQDSPCLMQYKGGQPKNLSDIRTGFGTSSTRYPLCSGAYKWPG